MKFLNKSIAIGLLIGIYSPILISCSYLPEPLNDPAVSTFGKNVMKKLGVIFGFIKEVKS